MCLSRKVKGIQVDTCEPLHFPSPWPPPESPDNNLLASIEKQIVDQLTARSCLNNLNNWPDSRRRQIAQLISDAIKAEKDLSNVQIHPNDPIELLFWGANDDMSALVFSLVLQKQYGIKLTSQDFHMLWRQHATTSDLIEFCLRNYCLADH